MKKLPVVAALLLATVAGRALADSIDDAEAKRRGVPVELILLERQLDDEKRKNADLEKQIAEVQGKIDGLKSGAAVMAGGVLLPKQDPQLPKPVEGPRESSPAYDGIIAEYMSGDWSKLPGEIAKDSAQLAKLPAGNAADIAYVKAAVAECRPAWWQRVKSGTPQSVQVTAFNHTIPVNFTTGKLVSNAGTRSGKVIVLASWPADQMDSAGPIDAKDAANLPAGDFTQGDWVNNQIWNAVAQHLPMVEYGELKLAELEHDEEANLANFQQLVGTAAAMYYGTPSARYLELRRCAEFFHPKPNEQRFGARFGEVGGEQYLVAFVAAEMVSHPQRYPGLNLSIANLPAELPAHNTPEQYILETFVLKSLQAGKLTFAEDCALRQAVWQFVMDNTDWTADHINLPNGKVRSFDFKQEDQAMKDRWDAFRQITQPKPAEAPIPPPAAP